MSFWMRIRGVFGLLVCLCVAMTCASSLSGQVKGGRTAPKSCSFSLIGTWRPELTAKRSLNLYSFASNGWVTVLEYSPDQVPDEYEQIAAEKYHLDVNSKPMRLDFISPFGDEAFPRGTTSISISEYGDDSFIAVDPKTGQQTQWVRLQTHRYFLTFAARSGSGKYGARTFSPAAFAMLTVLNGRESAIEAIGAYSTEDDAAGIAPVFGRVSSEMCNRMTDRDGRDAKSDKIEVQVIRIELNEREYAAVRQIFDEWAKSLKEAKLPQSDPYLNAKEFLTRTAESLNQCGEKVKLLRPAIRSSRDDLVSRHTLPQYLEEYVRVMKKENGELRVTDRVFPWGWQPVIHLH